MVKRQNKSRLRRKRKKKKKLEHTKCTIPVESLSGLKLFLSLPKASTFGYSKSSICNPPGKVMNAIFTFAFGMPTKVEIGGPVELYLSTRNTLVSLWR
jgi:hypothetical protein